MSETDINATVNVTEDIYADVDSTAMSAAVIDDGDSIVVPAEVDFGQTLDTELEDNDLIDVPVDESVGIAGDHRVLLRRDAPNQHPMSAITGLDDTIAGINTALSSRISQVEAETAELDVDMADALLRIGDLQNQVDGNITTWFYAAEPAMNLPPVAYDPSNPHDTGWDTDDKKNEHKGDLYYNTLTGYAYRFAYSDGAYGWLRITDTDVVKALADAAHAQDTADSKRRVFYTTPYPPYDKGDLWVQGNTGDILVCSTDKPADGSYSASDWSLASKYTDDTVADMALASANGKNTVYHQASQPTGGTYKKGDTWFDTDDDFTMYTYDGALWIKEQFGNEALADLSVTNAKIANATIEYGKIKSVDAGKITVGYLDANRIEAGSIGTSKIAAGAITADKIAAHSIGASLITVSDSTNLATANELYESSLPTDVSEVYKIQIRSGYLTKKTATQQYLMLTDYTPNSFKTGDELYYEFTGKAAVAGRVTLRAWGYEGTPASPTAVISNGAEINLTTANKTFSGVITLGNASWGDKTCYLLGFSDTRDTTSQIYIKNCAIRRKSGGNLIVDGAITTDKLDAGAVTTAKLDAGAVTADKIGAGAVTTAKLDANAVTADKINAGAVTTAKLDAGAVTTAKLDASAVTADKIAANAVTAGKIASGAVTADKIEANAITLGKISSAAQAEILNSNVLVGGRNLLNNSARTRVSLASAPDSGGVGTAYVTPVPNLTAYGLDIMNNTDDCWTYSFDYKVTGNTATSAYIYAQAKGTQASNPIKSQNVYNTPIGHFTHTFKLTAAQASATSIYCGIRLRNATDGAILTVNNLKIEKGNKETDWSPAPEDVINDNLLVGSKKMGNWVCDTEGARAEGTEYAYVTLNCSSTSYRGSVSTRPMMNPTTLNGTPLTVSFDYTASVDTSIGIGVHGSSHPEGYTGSANSQTIYKIAIATLPASSSYARYSITLPFTTSADLTGGSGDFNSLYFRIYTRTIGSVVRLRRIKAEYGSYATAWNESSKDYKGYITRIDNNGIRIHPAATENDSVVINSSGMEVFKGNVSVAKYGDEARVGKANSNHITINSDELLIYTGAESGGEAASFSSNGITIGVLDIDDHSIYMGGAGSVSNPEIVFDVVRGKGTDDSGSTVTGGKFLFGQLLASAPTGGLLSMECGYHCTAAGYCSRAFGKGVDAGYDHQTIIGKYNDNKSTDAFEIGWGTSSTPKNIFEVTTGGTVNIASSQSYKVNGTVVASARAKTTITPTASGVSNYSSYGNSYYEKAGNVVHVHIGVKGVTANTVTAIYTLPSGYKPTSIVYGHGTGGTSDNIGYMEVTTAGVISVRSSSGYIGADVTYFV